ncbi:unnamed protein product [Trichobilharzia regenti]|nr:unnamed protein product [Trichobilharzia regenti]
MHRLCCHLSYVFFFVLFLFSAQKGCTAYDVAINPEFYEKVKSSELFEAFLMTVIFEGLENKYGIDLEKSKHQFLKRSTIFFQSSCNPKVIELPDPPVKGDTPKYELVQVNYDNSEKLRYLIARISLPKLVSLYGLNLSMRILSNNLFIWF